MKTIYANFCFVLLFLIYINDLPNAIISKPRLFADDTCLILNNPSASALETACNLELHNLYEWCNANKLQINPQKSAVLTIPSKLNSPKLDLNINYNASPISCYESCYYLGVYIDSKTQFKANIKQIEVKIAKAVGILNKLRFFFPKTTLLLLYYALVHPHLLYALPVWGCTFPSYLRKLQCLQNKAIRIIFNSNRLTSVTPIFHALEILKIEDLFKYGVGKLMFQFSKKTLPLCFSSLFTYTSAIHNRSTRSQSLNNLYLPNYSTRRCQRCICFPGTKIWNSISPEIKILSYNKFKISLKKQLLSNYIK